MPSPPLSPVLIETCLEGGALSEEEIAAALRGKATSTEVKAIISLIERFIGNAHTTAQNDRTQRDEACGAASWLKDLRTALNAYVSAPPA
jgi:hypothetical protein